MSTIPFTPRTAAERPDENTLTDRQRKVLDAIKTHLATQGFAPSFREIGEAAGLKSPSSVKHQLQVLDEKGFIHMNANKGRAIEVVEYDDESSSGKVAQVIPFPSQEDENGSIMASHDVPLVGRIAAGVPITAEQHIDDVMRLPERLTGTGNLFMLEVHGDSMIDAAICDGDFVVVREQNSAENGDIVAALLDDEATVKTFRKDHGHVWLIPHNPAYSPSTELMRRSWARSSPYCARSNPQAGPVITGRTGRRPKTATSEPGCPTTAFPTGFRYGDTAAAVRASLRIITDEGLFGCPNRILPAPTGKWCEAPTPGNAHADSSAAG